MAKTLREFDDYFLVESDEGWASFVHKTTPDGQQIRNWKEKGDLQLHFDTVKAAVAGNMKDELPKERDKEKNPGPPVDPGGGGGGGGGGGPPVDPPGGGPQ